ncbi:MAG: hypothetical protein JRI71_15470 [Deltaproteobacteria bacterium]|nr:hypothetical protein [Deltaproteobacteria bacterium]
MKSRLVLILFGLMLVPSPNAPCEDFKGPHLPPLTSSLRVSAPLSFCGEEVPIDIQDSKERLEKELLLTLWDRPQVILWLKRSGRYLPNHKRAHRREAKRGLLDKGGNTVF